MKTKLETVSPIKKRLTVDLPVEKVVERTTTTNNNTTTTTIIQQPQTLPVKSEPVAVKPEQVIKKEPIDTTKSHDTTSKK